MLVNVTRDPPLVPAMERPVRAFAALLEEMRATLMSGRRERGRGCHRMAAAIAHAMAFETWRSLACDGGLDDGEVIALLTAAVEEAGQVRKSR
jgi:hypothetical protein